MLTRRILRAVSTFFVYVDALSLHGDYVLKQVTVLRLTMHMNYRAHRGSLWRVWHVPKSNIDHIFNFEAFWWIYCNSEDMETTSKALTFMAISSLTQSDSCSLVWFAAYRKLARQFHPDVNKWVPWLLLSMARINKLGECEVLEGGELIIILSYEF